MNEYYADQARVDAGQTPNEHLQAMAAGVRHRHPARASTCRPTSRPPAATPTGRPGWRAGRPTRRSTAPTPRRGYPDEPDPTQRAYLTQLAQENCTDGWRYRAGDNADMAIGQGETTVSPLQLAVAYSAMVNGGTVWNPTIGWAVVDAHRQGGQDDHPDGEEQAAGRASRR